ncbi:hypothetical protein BV25DRAFT_767833 [Artomyces pyxidatus]|uniref:Uncharacterized protein n=1 Tax=Artomyces pyxidatus TaxID=48021 RepID=A0ACB8SYK2_9AGAM|nr:hypothetical protein BV25DRAFT_767833 [Artomyces pyxidatus]
MATGLSLGVGFRGESADGRRVAAGRRLQSSGDDQQRLGRNRPMPNTAHRPPIPILKQNNFFCIRRVDLGTTAKWRRALGDIVFGIVLGFAAIQSRRYPMLQGAS